MAPLSTVEIGAVKPGLVVPVSQTQTEQAVASGHVSVGRLIDSQSAVGTIVASPHYHPNSVENRSPDNKSASSKVTIRHPPSIYDLSLPAYLWQISYEILSSWSYDKEVSDNGTSIGRRLLRTADDGPNAHFHSLFGVCSRIIGDSSLAHSHIVTFRCYRQRDFGIVHRFIVLELRGDHLTHSWLRFDRRPGWGVPFSKIAASGALSKDSVSTSLNITYARSRRSSLLGHVWRNLNRCIGDREQHFRMLL